MGFYHDFQLPSCDQARPPVAHLFCKTTPECIASKHLFLTTLDFLQNKRKRKKNYVPLLHYYASLVHGSSKVKTLRRTIAAIVKGRKRLKFSSPSNTSPHSSTAEESQISHSQQRPYCLRANCQVWKLMYIIMFIRLRCVYQVSSEYQDSLYEKNLRLKFQQYNSFSASSLQGAGLEFWNSAIVSLNPI